MRKILLYLFVLALLPVKAFTQDSIPDLVISEWRGDEAYRGYMEVTNMGDTALDLSQFSIVRIQAKAYNTSPMGPEFQMRMDGMLAPGASYLICNKTEKISTDGIFFGTPAMQAIADRIIYLDDTAQPIAGTDSVSVYKQALQWWKGKGCTVVWYHRSATDSFIIDGAGNEPEPPEDNNPTFNDVAGVAEAVGSHILVRKFTQKQGNPNFSIGRGVDAQDSEWMLIPMTFVNSGDIYTTPGNHGDFYIELSTSNPAVTVDTAGKTLTLPWGIYRGDSVRDELTLGKGMSWWFNWSPVFADSVNSICQTGDTMIFYACGNVLRQIDMRVVVSEPANDMALVFPSRTLNYPSLTNDLLVPEWGGFRYYVTEDVPGMDTIGNVPFATRVDTLNKYIEWASNATAEMVWVDGMERTDLKWGDKLKVTAGNGTTIKEYFIGVLDYAKSDDANLSAITYPDMSEDFKDWGFDFGWKGDTIPGFSPAVKNYNLMLPYGTKQIPALKITRSDLNSSVTTVPATNLAGTIEYRTTTFTVLAEDDSTEEVYQIVFQVESNPDKLQKFKTDPLISEWSHKMDGANYLEIWNPSNVEIDLSQYLIVLGENDLTPVELIQDTLKFNERYKKYVPGFKYTDDTFAWDANKEQILEIDVAADPNVGPGDIFMIGGTTLTNGLASFGERIDQWFANDVANSWGQIFVSDWDQIVSPPGNSKTHYLFRIENDSILEGTKAITDPRDFTLVDVFGHIEDKAWDVAGLVHNGKKGHHYVRKSHIWQGNPDFEESAGTNTEDSEWIAEWLNKDVDILTSFLGVHEWDPITHYISTVKSLAYLVDDGYEGDLSIKGVSSGEKVQQFFDNLLKGDPLQTLEVKDKSAGDAVAEGDSLIVTGSDGVTKTKYLLSIAPLSSNATLLAKDGSGLSININGNNGTVSGFNYGVSLRSIVEKVETESDLAVMYVVDSEGFQVPLQVLNFDFMYVETQVSAGYSFKVVAQDNTVNTYQLMPTVLASDAFVVSDVYTVAQDVLTISLIPGGTAVAGLFANIELSGGASGVVLDKFGFERSQGNLTYDDKLKVTSEDQSKTVYYYLTLIGEEEPDFNMAPTVSVAFADTSIKTNASTINISATADDDGMPLPPMLTYSWKVIEGVAANVTIASADALSSDVTFSATGNYKLQITVDDGELSAMDVVTVSVSSPDNKAPVVSVAFADTTIDRSSVLSVSATATDDGLPSPPASLTYEWKVTGGAAADVTISNPGQLTTNVTISKVGTYTLQFSASDSEVASTATITVKTKIPAGIENIESGIRMYPNPAIDVLTLELMNLNEVETTVKIFSLTGKAVFNGRSESNRMDIDVSSFDAGVYFVTVKAGSEYFTKKLNIMR